MSEDKNSPKPQLTPQQIQQLIAMQQAAGQNQQVVKASKAQKTLAYILKKAHQIQHHLDRFVNFVTKPHDNDRNDVIQAARSPILFGVYIIIIFVGIGGIWSAVAPLNSAVVAVGMLTPSSNRKTIQHQEGGVVKEIFVRVGDHVNKGDKLIELEDIKTKGDYQNILNQYRTSLANESRLIAERDNLNSIEFPEFLTQDIIAPEVAKILHTQENLFKYKKGIYLAEKEQIKQKIQQIHKQIEAYQAKKVATNKNLTVINDRLKAIQVLQDKGFAAKASLLEIEAKKAGLVSEMAVTETEIARTRQEITKAEIENLNTDNRYITDILKELKETQVTVAALREKYNSSTDALGKIIIKSPVDGIVNNINIHTIGGVISAATPILEISPINDVLVIEAKIPHKNIDSVHVGLIARIRFSAFKSRTTPLFTGKVVSISPDIVQDRTAPAGAEPHYIARVEIDMEEFNKIAKVKKLLLHPGMQAEVQIVTGTRTLFRYLLDPVTDTMFKAFREK